MTRVDPEERQIDKAAGQEEKANRLLRYMERHKGGS